MQQHCKTCHCYEYPIPVGVYVGQWIRNRLTGEIGQVRSVQAPNPPWHNGGTPFVQSQDGQDLGWWAYYDLVEEF